MQGMGAGHIPPNVQIAADQDIDLDGIAARLVMAPGETGDTMAVWLPEARVLFPGDNWYHAFPNLYAIRGTPYRDFAAWADTLARLAELGAEVLAPGHTMPVFGADKVRTVLTTTEDAIREIMRQTARMMDEGRSLDDITASVALPPNLAALPWLGEFYGMVGWSARAYAVGTLGWYDGNPTNLGVLTTAKRAAHMAALAGGPDGLARAAAQTDDLQWRLELCDALIALGEPAHARKAETLEQLAEATVNAPARNSYLWHAAALRRQAGEPQ